MRGAARGLCALLRGPCSSPVPQAAIAQRSSSSSGGSGGSGGAGRGGSGVPPASAADPAAQLRPGAVFTATKRFSAQEVATFAALTGDANPIHVSTAEAQRRGLPAPVLPGLLMASLFPAIIGSHFPGALYLSQTLKFKRHALVGDSLEARLTVERCSGSRVAFQTACYRSSGSANSGSSSGSTRSSDSSSSSSGSICAEVLVEGTALALIRPSPGRDSPSKGAAEAEV